MTVKKFQQTQAAAGADKNATIKSMLPIQYRNSKLTLLLKESFGGNAKSIMVSTLQDYAEHYQSSGTTLQYSTWARHIKNNPTCCKISIEELEASKSDNPEIQRMRQSINNRSKTILAMREEEMRRKQDDELQQSQNKKEIDTLMQVDLSAFCVNCTKMDLRGKYQQKELFFAKQDLELRDAELVAAQRQVQELEAQLARTRGELEARVRSEAQLRADTDANSLQMAAEIETLRAQLGNSGAASSSRSSRKPVVRKGGAKHPEGSAHDDAADSPSGEAVSPSKHASPLRSSSLSNVSPNPLTPYNAYSTPDVTYSRIYSQSTSQSIVHSSAHISDCVMESAEKTSRGLKHQLSLLTMNIQELKRIQADADLGADQENRPLVGTLEKFK